MTPLEVATLVVWVAGAAVLLARRRPAAAGLTLGVAAAGTALVLAAPGWWAATAVLAGAGLLGSIAFVRRWRRAGELDRARMQWLVWGVLTSLAIAAVVAALSALLDWPHDPGAAAVAATVAVPIGLAVSCWDRAVAVVDRVLFHTIVAVGLVGLVGAVYLIAVLGLGRRPDDAERSVLALSMGAAAVAAVLAGPARRRLEEVANERLYGAQGSPDEALRSFGGRMSRAVPMDELLLQLVESLRTTMHLSAAEIWTGSKGVLDRSVSVPDAPVHRLTLSPDETTVTARAHVQGNAWLQIWLPALLDEHPDRIVRMAAVAHLGDLLGLIVVERPADAVPFTEEEDRVLTELARQVGLALHNVRLDSALQASLEELEERNRELAASRLRIVTAADESRRRIERDLHDGAQQHLVALAVKVGLVKQLLDADPATAAQFLDELREDVQATLTELRDLAHGIYPPLLRDRGLTEALRTAANRAQLPTSVESHDVARYPGETEAAVYFCCLEAMQNAGKHAGADARITVSVSADAGTLRFAVHDDGPGFDLAAVAHGAGFVNMRDRLGAVGGELWVETAPGAGTTIRGEIPVAADLADADRGPRPSGRPAGALPAPAS